MRPLTTTVVCVSEATREEGVAVGTCHPQRTVVVHNAVDVRSFAERAARGGTPEVVGVGRFAYPKDFATLVAALRLAKAPCHVRLWRATGLALTEVDIRTHAERAVATGRAARRPEPTSRTCSARLGRLRALEPLRGLPGVRPRGHGGRLAGGGDRRSAGSQRAVVDGETGLLVPAAGTPSALAARPRAARGGRRAAATPGSRRPGKSAQALRRLALSAAYRGALLGGSHWRELLSALSCTRGENCPSCSSARGG